MQFIVLVFVLWVFLLHSFVICCSFVHRSTADDFCEQRSFLALSCMFVRWVTTVLQKLGEPRKEGPWWNVSDSVKKTSTACTQNSGCIFSLQNVMQCHLANVVHFMCDFILKVQLNPVCWCVIRTFKIILFMVIFCQDSRNWYVKLHYLRSFLHSY